MRSFSSALVSVPPLAAVVLVGAYLVVETVAPGTVTAPRPQNLAEAVVRENVPGTIEWLDAGGDINAPQVVRAGVFDARSHRVTPIEAALMARRMDLVHVLVAAGADVSRAPRAACLAQTLLPQALPALGLGNLEPREGSLDDCLPPTP
jgi:hypothetical protein